MLYLLHGTDINKKQKERIKILDLLSKKFTNTEKVSFGDVVFDITNIESLISSQGLFGKRFLVSFDSVLENENIADVLLERLLQMSESENIFIFSENKILKEILKKFEKTGAEIQEFPLLKKTEKENVFAIANALERKNKKEIWIIFNKLTNSGIPSEKILGILFWKTKDMILRRNLLAGGQKFSEAKLKSLSSQFLSAYHDGHGGGLTVSERVEKIILKEL